MKKIMSNKDLSEPAVSVKVRESTRQTLIQLKKETRIPIKDLIDLAVLQYAKERFHISREGNHKEENG